MGQYTVLSAKEEQMDLHESPVTGDDFTWGYPMYPEPHYGHGDSGYQFPVGLFVYFF